MALWKITKWYKVNWLSFKHASNAVNGNKHAVMIYEANGSYSASNINPNNRKWQDYVYIQCEYKSTKQKIKHLLREENKVKENKIS